MRTNIINNSSLSRLEDKGKKRKVQILMSSGPRWQIEVGRSDISQSGLWRRFEVWVTGGFSDRRTPAVILIQASTTGDHRVWRVPQRPVATDRRNWLAQAGTPAGSHPSRMVRYIRATTGPRISGTGVEAKSSPGSPFASRPSAFGHGRKQPLSKPSSLHEIINSQFPFIIQQIFGIFGLSKTLNVK